MEVQLQRAKFEGLAAVESLLKTSLGNANKETYYFIIETTKEGLNDILTGKIRNVYLIPPCIEYNKSIKILIKRINPIDSATTDTFILDSIYINSI